MKLNGLTTAGREPAYLVKTEQQNNKTTKQKQMKTTVMIAALMVITSTALLADEPKSNEELINQAKVCLSQALTQTNAAAAQQYSQVIVNLTAAEYLEPMVDVSRFTKK